MEGEGAGGAGSGASATSGNGSGVQDGDSRGEGGRVGGGATVAQAELAGHDLHGERQRCHLDAALLVLARHPLELGERAARVGRRRRF
eukprot:scaffold1098_cov118-Isochrysis_galbana.AAC.1